MALKSCKVFAFEGDLARCNWINAGNNVEDCRLACTVRTDKCTDLALVNVEVNFVESGNATKFNCDVFKFDVSILILACVVFGGIGNIWGVILGASILAYLPERIRFISNARQLVFGLVLILMMNFRPDGLLPRKKREKITEKGAK